MKIINTKNLVIISILIVVLLLFKQPITKGYDITILNKSNELTMRFYDSDKNQINTKDYFSIVNYAGTNNLDIKGVYYVDFTAAITNVGQNNLDCTITNAQPLGLYNGFPTTVVSLYPGKKENGAWTSSLIPIAAYESTTPIRFNVTVTCSSPGFTNVVHNASIDILIKLERVPNYCYQESPKVANQDGTDGSCGQLYTGTITTSLFGNNPSYVTDGNWDTSGYASTTPSYKSRIYITYTRPPTALPTSIWKVKDGAGIANLVIPAACWYGTTVKFYIMSESLGTSDPRYCNSNANCKAIEWGCIDNTLAEIPLRTQSSSSFNYYTAYEEAMNWDVP